KYRARRAHVRRAEIARHMFRLEPGMEKKRRHRAPKSKVSFRWRYLSRKTGRVRRLRTYQYREGSLAHGRETCSVVVSRTRCSLQKPGKAPIRTEFLYPLTR